MPEGFAGRVRGRLGQGPGGNGAAGVFNRPVPQLNSGRPVGRQPKRSARGLASPFQLRLSGG